jgi:hypothetical protein
MSLRNTSHGRFALFFLTGLLMYGCGGTVLVTGNIVNVSSHVLVVTQNNQVSLVSPNTTFAITYLAVIKTSNTSRERRKFDCCPCRTDASFSIKPKTAGKVLIKDPTDRSNWKIIKERKEVSCDFEVHDSDIK